MENNNQPTPGSQGGIYLFCLEKDIDPQVMELAGFARQILEPAPQENFRFKKANALAQELRGLGFPEMAEKCHMELSLDDAKEYGEELFALSEHLKEQHEKTPTDQLPHGAVWETKYIQEEDKWMPQLTSSFREALETIEVAGRWYKTVSSTELVKAD